MRKRILSLVLAVCVFMATVPALAYAECDYKDRIIDTLNAIETQKENVGLGNVDFSELKIGEEVHVYNYANGGFVEVRSAFPLFAEDVMVAIMYSIGEDSYQLMGKLPERINSTGFTKLAIIYDRMGCYVYNGEEMEMIAEADMVDLSKDVLTVDEIEDFGDIELADLQYKVDLGYTSPVQSRVQTTYTLNISQVLQSQSNLCWAASIACMSNYLNGTNWDDEDAAMNYDNSTTVINQRLAIEQAIFYIRELFPTANYTLEFHQPSDGALISNMMNRKPIYGSFFAPDNWEPTYHAVVVYGYSLNGYIWVMDPEFGCIMVTKTGSTYTYISSYSGVELQFARAICAYWE